MTSYFLKFPDEATAQAVLAEAGIYVEPIGNNPGYYRDADIGWAFDPVGIIKRGGTYDQVTHEELIPPTVLEGWHANFIGETLPEALVPFVLDPPPKRPYRIFFA